MTYSGADATLPPGARYGQVQAVRHASGPRMARVFLHGHPCVYEVRAARTPDGPVLLDMRVTPLEDGGQVTADTLKSIPVRRVAAAAIGAGAFSPDDDLLPPDEPEELDWSRWREPEKPKRKRAGRPPVYGPEHYAEVAEVARTARASGKSARRAIAERWSMSETTADKWMREARRLGLLEPYRRPPGGGSAR